MGFACGLRSDEELVGLFYLCLGKLLPKEVLLAELIDILCGGKVKSGGITVYS